MTDKKGVHLIIDVIGKDYWEQNMQSVAVDGRMVILAFMSGPVVDGVNLGMILRKRITVKKLTMTGYEYSPTHFVIDSWI